MKTDMIHSNVRPIVTYAFALALIVGFFLRLIPADVFQTIAASVIMFWFGQRSADSRATDPVPPGDAAPDPA